MKTNNTNITTGASDNRCLSSADLLADVLRGMLEAYRSLNKFSHDNRNEMARGRDRARLRNARAALDFYATND